MDIQQELLTALSTALFEDRRPAVTPELKDEAIHQAVYSLLSTDLESLKMVAQNMRIFYEQQQADQVLRGIPYVVFKGMAAAIYYPWPIRRAFGDLDLIVQPRDFPRAYQAFINAGYEPMEPPEAVDRHAHFKKDRVMIELHKRYAELNTREQEILCDQTIFEAIPHAVTAEIEGRKFPMLPAPINGLTLLVHISEHLEEALGMRQILDWVLFVNKELHDEQWPAFQEISDRFQLTTMAKVTARLGQLYLGLPEEGITWCRDVNEQVCADLLAYVMECGNFGSKLSFKEKSVTMVLSHGKGGLHGFFQNLQKRGEANWEALQKHPRLKPFAWLYQAGRYTVRGFKRKRAIPELMKNMVSSRRRNKLMEALGATQQVVRDADESQHQ